MDHPLVRKITSRDLRVAVIGLGYVGLSLMVTLVETGFEVIGIDINQQKVDLASQGESSIPDISNTRLRTLLATGKMTFTTDISVLATVDVISVCVSTSLNKMGVPDLSSISIVMEQIHTYLHGSQLILLESTIYPGATEELALPILEATGQQAGVDFFLAFSPERIDPGNPSFNLKNTPKVVGGITPLCTQLAYHFYNAVIEQVIPVSSVRVAEMTKLLENTFRAINIGFINEMALICEKLQVDVWEVIEAAATKPFGFMRFLPGPGLGGHCIPVAPQYLSWKLRTLNYHVKFVEVASEINTSMPHYVVHKICMALNARRRSLNGSVILLLGVAYKANSNDARESPALALMQDLLAANAHVLYNDIYVPIVTVADQTFTSQSLTAELLETADCVVLLTNHSYYVIADIIRCARLIVDTRNMSMGLQGHKIHKL